MYIVVYPFAVIWFLYPSSEANACNRKFQEIRKLDNRNDGQGNKIFTLENYIEMLRENNVVGVGEI